MDNNEAAFRIKPAADISKIVRRLITLPPRAELSQFASRSDAEKLKILGAQVDELATALAALAGYIAARDGIKLE